MTGPHQPSTPYPNPVEGRGVSHDRPLSALNPQPPVPKPAQPHPLALSPQPQTPGGACPAQPHGLAVTLTLNLCRQCHQPSAIIHQP